MAEPLYHALCSTCGRENAPVRCCDERNRGAFMITNVALTEALPPHFAFSLFRTDGTELVRVSLRDGKVTLAAECNIDEAAALFWDAVARVMLQSSNPVYTPTHVFNFTPGQPCNWIGESEFSGPPDPFRARLERAAAEAASVPCLAFIVRVRQWFGRWIRRDRV